MKTSLTTGMLLFLFLFVGCGKERLCTCGIKLTPCLESSFEDFKKNNVEAKEIIAIPKDEGYLFWLRTDASAHDGTEDIINDKCEVVCIICGECTISGECITGIPESKFISYWKK
ncbi:MAG: hypothetical protein JNK41_11175 [Saprospiraceae bacterium]|nr:hypothetical protein [Saprospiraceae bacterium]